MSGFGERLQRLREARGWSRRKLEVEAAIPHGVISRLERVDAAQKRLYPSIPVAKRLARVFGVTLDYLCGMDTDEEELPTAADLVGA
jgi:transcriptional regulator with XRE-family HTH domain